MKYIKSLKLFLEEVEVEEVGVEIGDTDEPDIISQKKDLNIILKHISEYDNGKSQIDKVLLDNVKTDSVIEKELDKIIGVDDNENIFLSQYKSVAKLKKQIEKKESLISSRDNNIKKKTEDIKSLKSEDVNFFPKRISLETDIKNLNKEMVGMRKEISDLNKEISIKEKELTDKMSEKKKEVEEKIKNISKTEN